jgi:hypothetical protein
MRPTYRTLNKHLTLCGCDRQLFLCGLFIGLGLFLTFSSLIVGGVSFFCFAALGWFRARDPVLLRLLFNPGRFKGWYDPGIRRPFPVVIYADHSRF